MKKHKKRSAKVLFAVICVCVVISATAASASLITARYSARINSRYDELKRVVFDNGEG